MIDKLVNHLLSIGQKNLAEYLQHSRVLESKPGGVLILSTRTPQETELLERRANVILKSLHALDYKFSEVYFQIALIEYKSIEPLLEGETPKEDETILHFTPLIDCLVDEFSTATGLTYGVVWRYCQINKRTKTCYASKTTLAKKIAKGVSTVYKGLRELKQAGYIVDVTPKDSHYTDVRHLQVTNKIKMVSRNEVFFTKS